MSPTSSSPKTPPASSRNAASNSSGARQVTPDQSPCVPAAAVPPNRALSALVLARAIAAALTTVAGVVALAPGGVVEVATYGPGEVVRGVAVRRSGATWLVAVHVVARYTTDLVLPDLAERIRSTTARVIAEHGGPPSAWIDVAIDDLTLPVEGSA